ncbi:GntR family transcriptional regulator [Streptomyces avermitilis]|uniref:GntR family transcriptional regulator n=1 Tax=Streptomyces avermitilis TaxID=33903 RepID=UPI00381A9097
MPKAAKYESVAESIRQTITTGVKGEGAELNPENLAKAYSTTKATASRALALLADKGVVIASGDGWTVAAGLFHVDTASSAGRDAVEPEAPAVHTAEELAARMSAKAEVLEAVNGKDVGAREVPKVLEGKVVTAHVDPDAERALKDPEVAADFNAAKASLRTYADLDGKRTDALKAVAKSLVTLRSHFQEPGSRKRVDWNGNSGPYQALVRLMYMDLGLEGERADSTKRAIRHHVEDRKREVVPAKDWDHYGIQALTRGERAGLEKRTAKALSSVVETSDATAGEASKGRATGHQLVTLAKRIDAGLAVFSTASLRVMSPAQRKTFVDQVREARDRADAILREAEGLED